MTKSQSKEDMIAKIVAAYASRPDVAADDIVALLARLRREMGDESAAPSTSEAQTAEPVAEPAVPIDKAMTKDKVYCLCCGKGFKMLKRHLGAEHGLSEAEYRAMFGLPEDMPLVAPSYSKKKADYAKSAGFGKYARTGRPAADNDAKVS